MMQEHGAANVTLSPQEGPLRVEALQVGNEGREYGYMERMMICLDVGGTQIKAAAVDENGRVQGEIRYFPAKAGETAGTVLDNFKGIIHGLQVSGAETQEVRMAFPGPFDYENGICLIQGLDKYDELYGLNLRKELSDILGIEGERIRFMNDAAAFALGEMGFGEIRGAERSLFLCIGTGCGSAFGEKGRLASPGRNGVPESGYLYQEPFLQGCIDDYLSRRGLMKLSEERLGTALDGKGLARLAAEGDIKVKQCFLVFGERVRDALLPFLDSFRPEAMCFGGQITGSAPLFLPPVEAVCRRKGIRLYVTKDTSLRTLQGLTRI